MADLKVDFSQTGSGLFDLQLFDLDRSATLTGHQVQVAQSTLTHTEQISETGFALEDTLNSLVIWSLFVDARASSDELPAGISNPRGWVGSEYLDPDRQQGSKLWLITDIPGKATTQRLRDAERYAIEALEHLIDSGIASSVDAHAEWIGDGSRLALQIRIYGDGDEDVLYDAKWSMTVGDSNAS